MILELAGCPWKEVWCPFCTTFIFWSMALVLSRVYVILRYNSVSFLIDFSFLGAFYNFAYFSMSLLPFSRLQQNYQTPCSRVGTSGCLFHFFPVLEPLPCLCWLLCVALLPTEWMMDCGAGDGTHGRGHPSRTPVLLPDFSRHVFQRSAEKGCKACKCFAYFQFTLPLVDSFRSKNVHTWNCKVAVPWLVAALWRSHCHPHLWCFIWLFPFLFFSFCSF